MEEIVKDPKARELGLGYEELGEVLLHNPDLYTSEGHVKNDTLKDYIKEKLFLKPNQLDYNHILHSFIPIK